MFSFQTAVNCFKHRLFFNLSNFNKGINVMICSNGQLPVLLSRHCSNKCLFQMQQFRKAAAMQEQQFRTFRQSCLLQNSPNTSSSMSALDLNEATTTNEEFPISEEKEAQQQLEETEKQTDLTEPIQKENVVGPKTFAKRTYWSQIAEEILYICYKMGKSGQKFIDIDKGFGRTTYQFKHIHVPEDVFGFVRAMDEVMKAVHANRHKIIATNKRQERLVLHTAKAKGKKYDYSLELYAFNNILFVNLRTVSNENRPTYRPRYQFLTLHQFHWLRTAIGELFAENGEDDVQQQLGKPPSYPNWLNIDINRTTQCPITVATSNRNSPNVQRQQSQRVAPVQQRPPSQPAQPEMSSSWAAMSEQLLQLVFLQQQQLQQVQSAILKDQPMGGVGGAIAQKMGPDNTILMSDLLAQAPPQPQSAAMPKWNGKNNVGYRKNWSEDKYLRNQGYRTDDDY